MNYTSYNKFKSIVMHEMPVAWDEIQDQQLNKQSLKELKMLAITLFSNSLEGNYV